MTNDTEWNNICERYVLINFNTITAITRLTQFGENENVFSEHKQMAHEILKGIIITMGQTDGENIMVSI